MGATLEIESGSNDPFAVFLTVMLSGWIASSGTLGVGHMLATLLLQFGLAPPSASLVCTIAHSLNRLALPAGRHPLLAVAGAVAIFGFANLARRVGFPRVYAGLVVGNRPVRASPTC